LKTLKIMRDFETKCNRKPATHAWGNPGLREDVKRLLTAAKNGCRIEVQML
jgi:hypothetical protein